MRQRTETSTSSTITGLDANTNYYVRVKGNKTGADSSGWSTESDAIRTNVAPVTPKPKAGRPGTPSDSNVGYNGATVSWSPSSSLNVLYRVQWSINSDFDSGGSADGITGTSYAITGLDANRPYYVRVQAYGDAYTDSDWATGGADALFTTTTAPLPVAGNPSDINSSNVSHNGATVSWMGSATSGVNYRIEWGKNSHYTGGGSADGITGTSYAITGLDASTPYYVQIQAYRSGYQDSAWVSDGNVALFTTPAAPPPAPGKPAAPTVNVAGTDANISWSDPAGTNITAYQVQVSTTVSFSPTVENTITDTQPHDVIDMEEGTYYARVRAYNGSFGPWSDESDSFTIEE